MHTDTAIAQSQAKENRCSSYWGLDWMHSKAHPVRRREREMDSPILRGSASARRFSVKKARMKGEQMAKPPAPTDPKPSPTRKSDSFASRSSVTFLNLGSVPPKSNGWVACRTCAVDVLTATGCCSSSSTLALRPFFFVSGRWDLSYRGKYPAERIVPGGVCLFGSELVGWVVFVWSSDIASLQVSHACLSPDLSCQLRRAGRNGKQRIRSSMSWVISVDPR